jgi:hypothetical protein
MSYRGAAALVLSVIAVGAALALTAGLGLAPPARTVPESVPVSSPLDPTIRSVQSQSVRLHDYLASAPELAPPVRDPFSFPRRSPSGADSRTAPAVAAALARPALKLIGLAEDPSPDGPLRTAVISGMGQLFLAKEGESFGGRFQVVRLGPDSVLLLDLLDQSTFTLALK